MFKNFVFGLIVTAAFSSIASANPATYGTWATKQQQDGFAFTMSVSIAASQTNLAAKCEYQGQSVTVSATVPSEVTDTQLILKGSGHDSKKIGALDCTVDFQPMVFDYQLTGDVLVLTVQGQSIPFNRVK